MKAIQDKAILFDDKCPVCRWYTKLFVQVGLLKPQNRIPLSAVLGDPVGYRLDPDRARHEIPLVDLNGGRTLYGYDAFFHLITRKLPFLAPVGRFSAVRIFFVQLYALISYNRRIIAGSPKSHIACDCAPDQNPTYQAAYIFVGTGLAVWMSWMWGRMIEPMMSLFYGQFEAWWVLPAVGVGWVAQMTLARLVLKENWLEYWGHLTTIMIGGLLLLLPVTALGWLPALGEGGGIFLFLPAVIFMATMAGIGVFLSFSWMLYQHHFRVKLLGLTGLWTLSWLALLLTAFSATAFLFLSYVF